MHSLASVFEYLTLPSSTKSNFFLQDPTVFFSSGLNNCVKQHSIEILPDIQVFTSASLEGSGNLTGYIIPGSSTSPFFLLLPCSIFSICPQYISLSLLQHSVLGLPMTVRSHANGCNVGTHLAEAFNYQVPF